MKDRDIIMVCQQDWNLGIDSNAKNLAKELSKHNRVLYVNMPLDINTVIRRHSEPEVKAKLNSLFGRSESLIQVEKNIWVFSPNTINLSINWIPIRTCFIALNRINSKLLSRSIREAAQELGFSNFYLIQDGIMFQALEFQRFLRPLKLIYYMRDYMLTVPYFRRHGSWAESILLKNADLVATNSAYLLDLARKHNPERSFDIGQGCVLSLYQADSEYQMPKDLQKLPKPLIGYTGYLTSLRLDLDLLYRIALREPSWSLVLVGPEDSTFNNSLLHSLPNVFFLGRKSPEELPAYLKHFDVCINPQLINEVTIGNYPLKIDEYLAMGKPVVATRTQAMELFRNYVYLARDFNEWILLLNKAKNEEDNSMKEAKVLFAKSHTWAESVNKLYKAIECT